jgi:hypothetical protein
MGIILGSLRGVVVAFENKIRNLRLGEAITILAGQGHDGDQVPQRPLLNGATILEPIL